MPPPLGIIQGMVGYDYFVLTIKLYFTLSQNLPHALGKTLAHIYTLFFSSVAVPSLLFQRAAVGPTKSSSENC